MQLMGLALGEGCFCVCLRRSQRRDLGDRRALLSGGGALLRWRGNALVGVIRRVLVGNERSRGFLQAEDRALKRGTDAAKHRQRPERRQRLIKVVENSQKCCL